MSSSRPPLPASLFAPVSEFQYRQMMGLPGTAPISDEEDANDIDDGVGVAETLRKEMQAEHSAATAAVEQRLRQELAEELKRERQRIGQSILQFEQSRKEYFVRVEREVVQLSLAIAAKILHRESQVDPLLITALVRVAVDQLKEGTVACIRVRPEDASLWTETFAFEIAKGTVGVVQDAALSPKDCILDTPLGSVNLSLDVQLKEVERGFLDILAQRPQL